jgi:hypothetical protein
MKRQGVQYRLSHHMGAYTLYIEGPIRSGMDTPARHERIKNLHSMLQEVDVKDSPEQEENPLTSTLSLIGEGLTDEEAFRQIGEGLLASQDSKVHSLEPGEVEEVRAKVKSFLDQLWDKFTSSEKMIPILNFVLKQYSETVAELVDARGTSLANASKLDSLRDEYEEFIGFTERLAKANKEKQQILQAKLDSLSNPGNRTGNSTRPRPAFSNLGEIPRSRGQTESKGSGGPTVAHSQRRPTFESLGEAEEVSHNLSGSKRRTEVELVRTPEVFDQTLSTKRHKGERETQGQSSSSSVPVRSEGTSYLTVRGTKDLPLGITLSTRWTLQN